jgi:hypothetical protein
LREAHPWDAPEREPWTQPELDDILDDLTKAIPSPELESEIDDFFARLAG